MKSLLALSVFAAMATIVGCQTSTYEPPKPEPESKSKADWEWDGMAPSSTASSIGNIAFAQAAAGARAEATLLPMHFNDAGLLNSLGLHRLDLIFHDHSNPPRTLFMNWPADDALMSVRRSSIEQWLTNAGVDVAAVALKDGPNPSSSTPAGPNLARIWKTERPGGAIDGSGDSDTSGLSPASASPQGFQSGGNSP